MKDKSKSALNTIKKSPAYVKDKTKKMVNKVRNFVKPKDEKPKEEKPKEEKPKEEKPKEEKPKEEKPKEEKPKEEKPKVKKIKGNKSKDTVEPEPFSHERFYSYQCSDGLC
jgi:hypothetical protein